MTKTTKETTTTTTITTTTTLNTMAKMLFYKPTTRPRLFVLAATICLCLVYVLVYSSAAPDILRQPKLNWPGSSLTSSSPPKEEKLAEDDHPISQLIRNAHDTYMALLQKKSHTLAEAAERYRLRRGRHPPPGFGAWFKAAQKHNAVVVEDFFDRVYHDINPFWALEPDELRRMAHSAPQVIRVRSRNATFETDNPNRPPFIQLWAGLLKDMQRDLPDLDMPVNVMDESRVLVPWEKMDRYVTTELAGRELFPAEEAVGEYTSYKDLDANPPEEAFTPAWITDDANAYWDHLRATCPPGTPARNFKALTDANTPIDGMYPIGPLPYTHEGFVANFTASQDVCLQPHLRGMHGTFIESVSMSTSHDLVPMFGGCKLRQNNEILIPGAMYLTEDSFYAGGKDVSAPWADKNDGLIWRGVASGGRNRAENWWHLHRHRWMQVMNGSTVRRIEAGDEDAAPTFRMPPEGSVYRRIAAAREDGGIGGWLDRVANVSFNNLECFPMIRDDQGHQTDFGCEHTNNYFSLSEMVPMVEQYVYKYLPDVDGHSYSARWRGFLGSSSCPLKATVYAEWHDDRLVPWVHFVPFDSSYQDIWAVMDYFLNGHDQEGERIARASREWAARTLRREDMLLYVWRLLLEYARVTDPKRDRLGFVDDLRPRKPWGMGWV